MEDVNKRRRIFLSLSKLECSPQELHTNSPSLTHFQWIWIKVTKFEALTHFKSDVFAAVAVVDAARQVSERAPYWMDIPTKDPTWFATTASGRSHNNVTILHYSQAQVKLFLTFRLTHNEPQDQKSSFLFNSDLFYQKCAEALWGKVWTKVKKICTREFFFSSSIAFYVPAVFAKNRVMNIVRYSS